jgi:von Willebrand factor type A domain
MEATVVCVDNSEWTRNGDFAPTRFQAQADAVNLLAGRKTEVNPENTVGVLTMAGKTPRVLVTPTPDLGKVLNSMHDLEIEGESNISSAVQIAQLALKHRQNKNQRQRVVIFVGSPITESKVGSGSQTSFEKAEFSQQCLGASLASPLGGPWSSPLPQSLLVSRALRCALHCRKNWSKSLKS